MMTALVTNEKWPFQFPWCRTLGVHPPLREGCPTSPPRPTTVISSKHLQSILHTSSSSLIPIEELGDRIRAHWIVLDLF